MCLSSLSLNCVQICLRLIDERGDWDRCNCLKVYNGLYLVSIRQFKRGGELLLDALSTFTATELISYNNFVALTVIVNSLTLTRVDLKKCVSSPFMAPHLLQLLIVTPQLISLPEVIQALPELPGQELTRSGSGNPILVLQHVPPSRRPLASVMHQRWRQWLDCKYGFHK